MTQLISSSLQTLLKWLTVIVTTAVVVITIQVNADSDRVVDADPVVVATETHANKLTNTPLNPQMGFADLIESVSPAVVHVAISGTVKRNRQQVPEFNFPPGSPFEDFFEQFRKRQQPEQKQKKRPLGIGSGFIISKDGYVVTNHHVIKGADEIIVTLSNGDEYNAELEGSDHKTDLALLKLKKAKDLPYVAWGNDEDSRVGDWVVAIGNPFGLGGTATTGIISARGRDIRSGPYDDYIQVDAAINRGNSGGPLFNLHGEVIGINTAIYSPNGGSVGIGFSIPSSMAKTVISQLRDSGEVERAWIGVQIQPLSDELAEGFERDNNHGALIASVVPGKPADEAGLQAGDIILSFDGQEIEEMRDLPRLVAQSRVGETYPMKVWRNGKVKKLKVTTDRFPEDDALVTKSDEDPTQAEDDDFGTSLAALTDQLREQYRIDESVDGVLVLDVYQEGLAAVNELLVGDVITSFNNRRIAEPDDLREALKQAQGDGRSSVVVLIQRKGGSQFVPFVLEQ